MGFAGTTFVLSWYNVSSRDAVMIYIILLQSDFLTFQCGVRGITEPNVVVGLALGYGGLAQFLAGMWEFAAGNT